MKASDLKFTSQMVTHMSFSNQHMLKTEITIEAPGTEVDGKKFYRETVTKKKRNGDFGKSESTFYFDGDKKEYNTAEELLESIGIKMENHSA